MEVDYLKHQRFKMADNTPTKRNSSSNPNSQHQSSSSNSQYYDIHIPLSHLTSPFNLATAVCSHGLFIMSPNQWDPLTQSLLRPLRLSLSSSGLVRISHGRENDALLVRVYGVRNLPRAEEAGVVAQVRRMLRLSEGEEAKIRKFQELHLGAKEVGFGRVFRSPTLFEDMIKAILFCNCQWPRTLSMAKALCDLQLELQSHSSVNESGCSKSEIAESGPESFTPRTPAVKESQRKQKRQRVVSGENADALDESNFDLDAGKNPAQLANGIQLQDKSVTTSVSMIRDDNVNVLNEYSGVFSEARVMCSTQKTGNFPSPLELASLDEGYLAKRCGLGYRAGRILKLAQGVVEGRIQLDQLEELCSETSLSNYNKADEMLKEIDGYGPFTRANVLMCLGFFNVVPSDSETIRHLKQVHGRTTTIQTVQNVVEEMYKRYDPYQFLAYWWEIWSFYEGHFGKFSEMPSSDYKLITASNMRTKKTKTRTKTS